MRAIDGEALYEKACDLEAQALSYIEKIIHDEDKVEEWKIWSAILTERTAFKHDIFDAPEVKPEPNYDEWCNDCKEYDVERHCCPRFNHVIRETVQEMRGGQDEAD